MAFRPLRRAAPALVALGLLAAAGPGRAEDTGKLTPPPALTPLVPTWTAMPPGTPSEKPLPKVIPGPPLRPAPPASPPLTGTPQVRDGGATAPAAMAVTIPSPRSEPAPTPAKPATEAPPDERGLRVATTEINVRLRPDAESRRVDVIDEGKTVEVIGPVIAGKWVRIARHGRALGYVSTEFLKPPGQSRSAEPAKPEAAPAGEGAIRYAATEINVRPRPDQDARRVDVIDEGTRLEVIGPLIHNEWVKVARHGRVLGYVSSEFLLTHPPKPH